MSKNKKGPPKGSPGEKSVLLYGPEKAKGLSGGKSVSH
jgi:hypothetical protein